MHAAWMGRALSQHGAPVAIRRVGAKAASPYCTKKLALLFPKMTKPQTATHNQSPIWGTNVKKYDKTTTPYYTYMKIEKPQNASP
jgi:hypothetical protein